MVVAGPSRHRCAGIAGPVVYGSRWHYPTLGGKGHAEGTVVECESCGKTWVAGSMSGFMGAIWREEGPVGRWRRERRSRKA